MTKQFMIIIEGPMGSGKTTIGNIIHKKLPRTAHLGIDKIKFLLSDFERGARDNALTSRVVLSMARTYFEQSCNVLLTQGMWKKEYLEPFLALARELGIDVYMYQLEAPKEVLLKRVSERSKLKNTRELTAGRVDKNINTWERNRYDLGRVFSTVEYQPEQIAELIMKDLESSSNIIH